jgi:hypothetical protein
VAISVITHQICDRCHKPYAEEEHEYGKPTPEYARKSYVLSHGDVAVLTFEDLCAKCDEVVQGLIARMKLDPTAKKPAVETISAPAPASTDSPTPSVS